MSSDVDKLCRAIYYHIRKAKSLEEAAEAVEIIIGSENAAIVNDKIAQSNIKM